MFQAVTDDQTPTLINEDAIREEHGWVKSLAEALSQIEYPWNCFYPYEMYPEFAAEILKLKTVGSKNLWQLLQKYAPDFGSLGISLNFVVAAAMLIVRPMRPAATFAVLEDLQREHTGSSASSYRRICCRIPGYIASRLSIVC